MGIPDKITISGKVFIKYIDDIGLASIGDVKLYLHDDAINPLPGDYDNLTHAGYIKAKICDGERWHHMDIGEFCLDRENKYPKKQRAIDSAYLCKPIIEEAKGVCLIKKYRGHFVKSDE